MVDTSIDSWWYTNIFQGFKANKHNWSGPAGGHHFAITSDHRDPPAATDKVLVKSGHIQISPVLPKVPITNNGPITKKKCNKYDAYSKYMYSNYTILAILSLIAFNNYNHPIIWMNPNNSQVWPYLGSKNALYPVLKGRLHELRSTIFWLWHRFCRTLYTLSIPILKHVFEECWVHDAEVWTS